MASIQILQKIRQEVISSGFDERYKTGAYEFVLNGLDFYLTQIGEKRHVSGQEFSLALLNFAHKQFGLTAKSVLNNWGIERTEDFGYIVYNLIHIGVLSKQPEDSLDHFFNVVDFSSWFSEQDDFEIDRQFIKRIKGA